MNFPLFLFNLFSRLHCLMGCRTNYYLVLQNNVALLSMRFYWEMSNLFLFYHKERNIFCGQAKPWNVYQKTWNSCAHTCPCASIRSKPNLALILVVVFTDFYQLCRDENNRSDLLKSVHQPRNRTITTILKLFSIK